MGRLSSQIADVLGIAPSRMSSILKELARDGRASNQPSADTLIDVWLAVMGGAEAGEVVETADTLDALELHDQSDELADETPDTFGDLLSSLLLQIIEGVSDISVTLDAGEWIAAAHIDDDVLLYTGPAHRTAAVTHTNTCPAEILLALLDLVAISESRDSASFAGATNAIH